MASSSADADWKSTPESFDNYAVGLLCCMILALLLPVTVLQVSKLHFFLVTHPPFTLLSRLWMVCYILLTSLGYPYSPVFSCSK